MGFVEFILYPVYVALFFFLFSARRKNYDDPVLQYYHKQGFWIRVVSVLFFTLFNTVLSPGDSFGLYYTEGANIYQMILKDASHIKWLYLPGSEFDQSLLRNPLNLGYFRAENNYMVARIVAILSFFSFGKYLITNLFFSMIAFSGTWRLYRFFYEQYPHLHKQLAIAILYMPTFVFWSSGILKDPICISSLGWITYAMYEAFYKKKHFLKNFLILAFFGFLLAVLKIYILISYVPFFILYLILKNVNLLKNSFVKWSLGLLLIAGSVIAGQRVMSNFKEELGTYAGEGITEQIDKQRSSYRDQAAPGGGDSNFSLGIEFDPNESPSVQKLLLIAPAAIIATFYRPFIWESRKISTLLSSFESMFIMFFTLYVLMTTGFFQFFRYVRKDPTILYCILFALLFGLFVGATTPNFGSLVRYKIPCVPFYVIALFLIQDKNRQMKGSPVSGRAA